MSKSTVSAENASFRLESGLIWLFFLQDWPAKRKRVIMNRISRFFMVLFEKAKINFYWIRAESDFIVFLQKNQKDETFCNHSIHWFDASGLLQPGLGAASARGARHEREDGLWWQLWLWHVRQLS